MQYDKPTTENHQLSLKNPKCLEMLDKIIVDEGGSCSRKLGNDVVVLNLDKVAKGLKAARTISTMDMTFGVTDENGKNAKMVLVDFKFRHKTVSTIGKSDLEDKVKDSRDIMGNIPPILPQCYFVFTTKLTNQATRHIARIFNNKPSIPYKSVDINDLLTMFFQ